MEFWPSIDRRALDLMTIDALFLGLSPSSGCRCLYGIDGAIEIRWGKGPPLTT